LANRINLEIQWIPRTENEKADYISRLIDTDDWKITEEFFAVIDSLWGPHSVDAMTTYYNKKIPKFFSRFWNPNSAGVDFLCKTWVVNTL
jgi:hypothetical protein